MNLSGGFDQNNERKWVWTESKNKVYFLIWTKSKDKVTILE